MTELKEFLEKNIEEGFQRILISNARKKEGASKLQVRPVLLKGQLWYQVTRTEGTKEIHKNYGKEELFPVFVQKWRKISVSSSWRV